MFESVNAAGSAHPAHDPLKGESSRSAWLELSLTALPGAEQIHFLSSLDIDRLDDETAILFMRAWERQARWVAAKSQHIIARVAGPRPANFDEDWAREEVATALWRRRPRAPAGGGPPARRPAGGDLGRSSAVRSPRCTQWC